MSAHVDVLSKLDAATVRTEAKAALTGFGWKAAIAHAAVAAAAVHGTEMTLERLTPDVGAADVPVLTMPMPRERDK